MTGEVDIVLLTMSKNGSEDADAKDDDELD